MRKNKVLFSVLAILLAVTCLLVSCNSEVANSSIEEDKGLAYISFGGGNSKTAVSQDSVTISYGLTQIDDVYWVYTATKADLGGKVGETGEAGKLVSGETPAKGLNGIIGPFSKGSWNFTLKGYKVGGTPENIAAVKAGTLVFEGSTTESISLTVTSTGNDENYTLIPITVSLKTEGTGVINLAAGTKFYWAPVNNANPAVSGDYEIKVIPYIGDVAQTAITLTAGDGYYYLASKTSINSDGVAAGVKTLKFDVVHGDIVLYSSGTFEVTVYGGQETNIAATTVENLFSYGKFQGTLSAESALIVSSTDSITITTPGSVSFTTDYTPASGLNAATTGEKTTVTVEGSAITADTYSLTVTTSNVEAANTKFTALTENQTAVASIDLTLLKNGVETSTFAENQDDGCATVTTYIATNLSTVYLYYDAVPFTPVGTETALEALQTNQFIYYKTDGKLVFKTSHFSEFYVTSTDEAINLTTGTAYATLQAAVNAVKNNETIGLLKDVSSDWIMIDNGKTFTLDLCGHSLSNGISLGNSFVTLQNGTLTNSVWVYSANSFLDAGAYNHLTVSSNVVSNADYSIVLSEISETNGYGSLIDISGTLNGWLWVMGNICDGNSVINVNEGAHLTNIALQGNATVNINEGSSVISRATDAESAIEVRGGNLNVNGGTIVCNYIPTGNEPNDSGTTTMGAGVGISQYHNSNINVVFNRGSISGYSAVYWVDVNENVPETKIKSTTVVIKNSDNPNRPTFESKGGDVFYIQPKLHQAYPFDEHNTFIDEYPYASDIMSFEPGSF